MIGYCFNFNFFYFDILMIILCCVINCLSYLYLLCIFIEKCILSFFDGKNFNCLYFFFEVCVFKKFLECLNWIGMRV